MTTMRAKLKVESVLKTEYGEQVKMVAVCKNTPYPADGSDEDNTYASFTPAASLEINIRNPNLYGKIVPGQKYYCDFELVEEKTQ